MRLYGSRWWFRNVIAPTIATSTSGDGGARRARSPSRSAEPHALQEEHDLEALAVDAREAEQRESEEDLALGARAGQREQALLRAVVVRDPAGPVDAVEEPVHDDAAARRSPRGRSRPAGRAARSRRLRAGPRPRPRRTRSRRWPRHRRRRRPRSGAAGCGCRRIRLATIAISTRIDSRPSRKTSRPLLKAAAPELQVRRRSDRRRRRRPPVRRARRRAVRARLSRSQRCRAVNVMSSGALRDRP